MRDRYERSREINSERAPGVNGGMTGREYGLERSDQGALFRRKESELTDNDENDDVVGQIEDVDGDYGRGGSQEEETEEREGEDDLRLPPRRGLRASPAASMTLTVMIVMVMGTVDGRGGSR